MNDRHNFVGQWFGEHPVRRAYTLGFVLGVVVTIAVRRLSGFIADLWSEILPDVPYIGLIIAVLVVGVSLHQGGRYLVKRYAENP